MNFVTVFLFVMTIALHNMILYEITYQSKWSWIAFYSILYVTLSSFLFSLPIHKHFRVLYSYGNRLCSSQRVCVVNRKSAINRFYVFIDALSKLLASATRTFTLSFLFFSCGATLVESEEKKLYFSITIVESNGLFSRCFLFGLIGLCMVGALRFFGCCCCRCWGFLVFGFDFGFGILNTYSFTRSSLNVWPIHRDTYTQDTAEKENKIK